MTTVSIIHFAAILLLVGTVLRLVETKWPDSAVGKALAFIY